jgi:hypothetical protein
MDGNTRLDIGRNAGAIRAGRRAMRRRRDIACHMHGESRDFCLVAETVRTI